MKYKTLQVARQLKKFDEDIEVTRKNGWYNAEGIQVGFNLLNSVPCSSTVTFRGSLLNKLTVKLYICICKEDGFMITLNITRFGNSNFADYTSNIGTEIIKWDRRELINELNRVCSEQPKQSSFFSFAFNKGRFNAILKEDLKYTLNHPRFKELLDILFMDTKNDTEVQGVDL